MSQSPILSLFSFLSFFFLLVPLVSSGFLADLFNFGVRSPSSLASGPPKFSDCTGCDERTRKCHQFVNITETQCSGLPEPSSVGPIATDLEGAPKLNFSVEKLAAPQTTLGCAEIPALQKAFQAAKSKRDDVYARYKDVHEHYEKLSAESSKVVEKFRTASPQFQTLANKRRELANKLENARSEYDKAKFDCDKLRPQDVDACSEFLANATDAFKNSDKYERRIDFLQALKAEKVAVIDRTKTILKHLQYIIAKEVVTTQTSCTEFRNTYVEESAKASSINQQLHSLPNTAQTIEKRTDLADQLTQLETDVDKLSLVVTYACNEGVTSPNVLAIDRLLEARYHPTKQNRDPYELENALDFAIETENRDRSNADDLKRLYIEAKGNPELTKFYNLIEQLREAQCQANPHFCDMNESVKQWLDERMQRYQAQVVNLDNILRELIGKKSHAEVFKGKFDELLVTKFDHCDAVLESKVKYYGDLILLLRKEGHIFAAILNSFFGDAFPAPSSATDKDKEKDKEKEKAPLRAPLENLLKAVNVDEFWKEFNYAEKRRPHKLSDFSLDSLQKFLLSAKEYVVHVKPFITDASHADSEQLFAKWKTNALTDIKTLNRSIDVFANHVLVHLGSLKMSQAFNPANRQPHSSADKFDVLSKSLDDFGKRVPLRSIDKLHCVFFSKEGDNCPAELRGLSSNGKVAQFESERRAYSSFYDLLLDPRKISDELKHVDFRKRQEENKIKQATYEQAKSALIAKLKPCDVISLQNELKELDANITKNHKGVKDLLDQLHELNKKKTLLDAELADKKEKYTNATAEFTAAGKTLSNYALVCSGLLEPAKGGLAEKPAEVKTDTRPTHTPAPAAAHAPSHSAPTPATAAAAPAAPAPAAASASAAHPPPAASPAAAATADAKVAAPSAAEHSKHTDHSKHAEHSKH